MIDSTPMAHLRQFYTLLYGAGDVIELRAPNAGRYKTYSGYFDNVEALLDCVKSVKQEFTLYICLNPVLPDLLARKVNRAEGYAPLTTKDAEIPRLRYLLVDFDGHNPSGTSTTDAEHDAILKTVEEARCTLQEQYGISALMLDSGNGGHLILPIDLPNPLAETSLLKNVLEGLGARFDNVNAHIDRSTHNASRLTKFPGSKAMKGDSTTERPHRVARLLHLPETFAPVSRETLQTLAQFAPRPERIEPTRKIHDGDQTRFDLQDFFARHGIAVSQSAPCNGGTRHRLAVCPFNPDHETPDAAVFELTGGLLGFKCLHDSCRDKHWSDFRNHFEPGYQNKGRQNRGEKFSAGDREEQERTSNAKKMLEITAGLELFQCEREEAFARVPHGDYWQTLPMSSGKFRKWLSYELWKAHENAPSGSALDDALRVLEAKALFESPRHELSVRVARDDQGALWYDLGEARDRAVCITSEGWEIVENPPPLFRRWALSDPQVEPVKGTSFAGLKDLLNLKDPQGHGFNLILAWLVACLFPEIAHPVLVIHGEQGSAKSTMAKLLVSLIDPSKTPLRSEPRNRPEWAQAADHCWMIAIDNLSRLPGWMSDAFCRAATGDADSKRALYTNSDDIILRFRRALVLTGISVVATRQDLLDRSILLPLEPISAEKRMSEEEVIANFEQIKPALLGRLFDLAVEVLRLLPDSPKRNLPRMADFAKIGIAVERACGWSEGTFMEAYNANLREVTREALSASPVASAVILWMKDRTEWSGTWQQLLKALNLLVGEEQTKSTEWPRSARALSAELKRAAPNLRTASIEQNEGRHSREGTRLTLINRRDTSSPSSPSSLFDDSEGDGSDAGDDGD